ncbi:rhodanese-like domain-containing protein (plasmid) [Methylobacterium sp. NMS12]
MSAPPSLSRRVPPAGEAPRVSPSDLVQQLRSPGEIAVLDVREVGVHDAQGHILLSAPLPLSHLEQRAATLLPRRSVPIVVYDGGEGAAGASLAGRAARRLADLGYEDVAVLEGGVAGWAAAGYEVYTGVHVLSKAFGEFVEHAYETPRLSARDLKAKLDRGEDLVVLDGRTLSEFRDFSIPGAYACPNAELPYRAHDLVRSSDTLVVVNCAGRTRSIIGAQALRNAGLPNPVVSLENGTMAWLGEGYPLNSGIVNAAPAPSEEGRRKARDTARHLRQRFGFGAIDRVELARLSADPGRTTYRLDVRTRAEYEAGHLPGSLWAEGGQLIQATDSWIGVRHARIVLVDDQDGVRAAITASWLIQLGWDDVRVFALDPATEALETGPASPVVVGAVPEVPSLTPDELRGGWRRARRSCSISPTAGPTRPGTSPGRASPSGRAWPRDCRGFQPRAPSCSRDRSRSCLVWPRPTCGRSPPGRSRSWREATPRGAGPAIPWRRARATSTIRRRISGNPPTTRRTVSRPSSATSIGRSPWRHRSSATRPCPSDASPRRPEGGRTTRDARCEPPGRDRRRDW